MLSLNAETVSSALCEHGADTASCIAVMVEGLLLFCGGFSYRNTLFHLTLRHTSTGGGLVAFQYLPTFGRLILDPF